MVRPGLAARQTDLEWPVVFGRVVKHVGPFIGLELMQHGLVLVCCSKANGEFFCTP
jgi:hypothetical protein